jgi:hypothetical protein
MENEPPYTPEGRDLRPILAPGHSSGAEARFDVRSRASASRGLTK